MIERPGETAAFLAMLRERKDREIQHWRDRALAAEASLDRLKALAANLFPEGAAKAAGFGDVPERIEVSYERCEGAGES